MEFKIQDLEKINSQLLLKTEKLDEYKNNIKNLNLIIKEYERKEKNLKNIILHKENQLISQQSIPDLKYFQKIPSAKKINKLITSNIQQNQKKIHKNKTLSYSPLNSKRSESINNSTLLLNKIQKFTLYNKLDLFKDLADKKKLSNILNLNKKTNRYNSVNIKDNENISQNNIIDKNNNNFPNIKNVTVRVIKQKNKQNHYLLKTKNINNS